MLKFLHMTLDDAKPIAKKSLHEVPPGLMTKSQRGKTYDELSLSVLDYLCSAKKATLETRIKAKSLIIYKLENGTLSDQFLTTEEYLQSRKTEDEKALVTYHGYLTPDEDVKKSRLSVPSANF